VTALDKKR